MPDILVSFSMSSQSTRKENDTDDKEIPFKCAKEGT
jgi:hypothetical protein